MCLGGGLDGDHTAARGARPKVVPWNYYIAHMKIHHRWHNDVDDVHTNLDLERTNPLSFFLYVPRFTLYWTGLSPLALFIKRGEWALISKLLYGTVWVHALGRKDGPGSKRGAGAVQTWAWLGLAMLRSGPTSAPWAPLSVAGPHAHVPSRPASAPLAPGDSAPLQSMLPEALVFVRFRAFRGQLIRSDLGRQSSDFCPVLPAHPPEGPLQSWPARHAQGMVSYYGVAALLFWWSPTFCLVYWLFPHMEVGGDLSGGRQRSRSSGPDLQRRCTELLRAR